MQPASSGLRAAVFVGIILLVAGMLSFFIITVQRDRNAPPLAVLSAAVTTSTDASARLSCESAGGQWIDCGSPCHGKNTDACATVCEPQCLCGGPSGWQCPANLACTDYAPDASTTGAIGVCRSAPPPVIAPSEPTSTPIIVPTGMVCGENNLICVSASSVGSMLDNPFVVTGTAQGIFENQFSWKLEDATGQRLGGGNNLTASSSAIGPPTFRLRAFILTIPKSPTGTLTLYEPSAKDGTPVNILRIPVQLPTAAMPVTIVVPKDWEAWWRGAAQFAQTGEAQRIQDTAFVPVTVTVVRTKFPMEATLEALLAWVASKPHAPGPGPFDVVSFVVGGHAARVVLDMDVDAWAGVSVTQAMINPLIEKTLLRFPGVTKVLRGPVR